jgi:flagellar hook-length control protein FliK
MNLSALNNLPANNPSSKLAEPSAVSADATRLKSETLRGADFASFLHNQVQALRNVQRPDIAVHAKGLPLQNGTPADSRAERVKTPADADKEPNNEPASTNRKKAPVKPQEAQKAEANGKDSKATQAKSESAPASETDSEQLDAEQKADDPAYTEESQTHDALSNQIVFDEANAARQAQATAPVSEQSSQVELLFDQTAALTTIAVSDKLQIITTAQTTANEQSVADFALAMGLDPTQVKTLFGESAANAAHAKLATTNTSTQQMLGMNSLPSFFSSNQLSSAIGDTAATAAAANTINTDTLTGGLNTPVSTADFQEINTQQVSADDGKQALLGKMENLQIQIGVAQTQLTTATPQPASTLAVLSMMDAQLRSEDIESLQKEFDALGTLDSSGSLLHDTPTPALPGLPNRTPNHAAAPAAQAFANNPDMAQTYDKLSQKLTTELAARMHEKLNAGEWKMKFALKPASLGLVDVQLEMKDGKLSAHFQSDTNLTQDLLQNGSQRLKDALADLGMNNASVFVAQGQAQGQGAQGQSARSGKFTQGNDNGEKLSEDSGLRIAEDPLPRRNNSSQFDSYA